MLAGRFMNARPKIRCGLHLKELLIQEENLRALWLVKVAECDLRGRALGSSEGGRLGAWQRRR
jgi:hypothetical protein